MIKERVSRSYECDKAPGFLLTFHPADEDFILESPVEDGGYEVRYLSQDDSPYNPREENDCLGTMACFHKRYTLGDKNHGIRHEDFKGWDEMEEALIRDRNVAVILPLFLMDHSGISISTTSFNDRWDSGQVGFIFVTRETVKKEYGSVTEETLKTATRVLEGEVQEYNSYLTGDVYDLVTEKFDKDKESLDYECVGGYFGIEYAREALFDELPKNLLPMFLGKSKAWDVIIEKRLKGRVHDPS